MTKKNRPAGNVGNIATITNMGGKTLSFNLSSGVSILTVDGYAFKDLNKNGKLDPYEDWRLPARERAKDLAQRMSIEQIAGLMLHSSHQAVPADGWFGGTYNGKKYAESGAKPWELTDQQKEFIKKAHGRHLLVTTVQDAETAARWNNNLQALAEALEPGIPVNISSDPRHGSDAGTEYNAGAGGDISMWPEALGLAATFDPELARTFGRVVAKEYRALGITTALSPQIDLATDPRWGRFLGTFGEDPELAKDFAKAVVEGYQTADDGENENGWGQDSIVAMVKHWPGGGTGEGGRDAHFGCGKYAVYPGNNFREHLRPFVEGAFQLEGGTEKAAAVMPYYTISYQQDKKYGENVGNAFSAYIINDLLRREFGYDGVVCTDWGVTGPEPPTDDALGWHCWGVEEGYTTAERHLKAIMAGVDQFGGNDELEPILEAYHLGVATYGEAFMRWRFEESAVRLLTNMFRLGLFENPYLDPQKSAETVGNSKFMALGYEAQLKSIVMLKNHNHVLPLRKTATVYIPKSYRPQQKDWLGNPIAEVYDYPVSIEIVKKYFRLTDNPREADCALVFMESPNNTLRGGYSQEDVNKGGNGYVPLSLQYGPYRAEFARDPSLAGDERPGKVKNRSYKNKMASIVNSSDLQTVLETREKMVGKPVIVVLKMANPTVPAEFEPLVDAILIDFGVTVQALLDIISGAAEPSGLLPAQMPANMKTVEEQFEDVPHDLACYVDAAGNIYDFAFGLNWQGVIQDERTKKYRRRRKK
ncbi:MAG: glycoside hydrolase family 3 protein [Firmicutes bacterium]|nr:glycoside hydrolase family 3 protein [Bacillota bacterium]